MVIILGDVHFSSAKDYFRDVSESILDWFDTWELNRPENDLILVGDIVDNAVNGGQVIDYVYGLVLLSRFRSIHILKGNHDSKKKDDIDQLAYKFLERCREVHIYEVATAIVVNNLKFLMLPYYSQMIGMPPMSQRYSQISKEFPEHYHCVIGHFADDTFPFGADTVTNLDQIDSDYICLGHIHTRINPEIYIGSIYSNKVGEAEDNRAAWVFHDDGSKTEDKLPNFAEFVSVKYPDPLPESKAIVSIYSITDATEQTAREKYGNIYIRKIISSFGKSKSDEVVALTDINNLNQKDLFRAFVKTLETPLDRRVFKKCLSLLPDTN